MAEGRTGGGGGALVGKVDNGLVNTRREDDAMGIEWR